MTEPQPFAGCFTEDSDAPLAFLGLPDDSQSSYLKGCARGPQAIRDGYDGRCYNDTTELGVDVAGRVRDYGDVLPGPSAEETFERYRDAVRSLLAEGKVPFLAGGDHAVTIPAGAALEALGRPVHVVQIDAHPDLYPDFEGSRLSHACTGARLLEMGHVASLTQLGIRTLNRTQRAVVERHRDRLAIHEARETPHALPRPASIPEGAPVYLTIDLDGIDPAFAPGVSHAVPGGLSARQLLDFVQAADWELVGMDVVELNPARDVHARTAVLAARLLHEGMGYALERARG